MPDRRIRNRLARRLAVFGPAGIVVLTGLLTYGAVQRLTESRRMVQHTHDVLDASSRVLVALLDGETATRGFVLTHDTTFLAPALTAPARARQGLTDLRGLTVDNPAQLARIDSLTLRVQQRMHSLDSIAALERVGRLDLTQSTLRNAGGPLVMADARRLIRSVEATEDSLLALRRADEIRSFELTTAVILAGMVIAAVLAFLVNRNYDNALRDRRRALAEAETANDQLQQNAIELEQQAEAAQEAAFIAEQATESARASQTAAEESERRAERLQAATEALTGALEITDVAHLIVEQAMRAMNAHSGALGVVDVDAKLLRLIALRSVTGPVDVGSEFPLDEPIPMTTAAREARPIVLESMDAIRKEFPKVIQLHRPDRIEALAAFPLVSNHVVSGVLLVRFDRPHVFEPADRALIGAMSRIAAEAFERARLFEAERESRQEAEAANRAKAAFLASMSHELRTPLQAALGFAQLVRAGVYGPVNDQQSEVLGRVERSQTHLARLIDDILDFARLEAGRVRIQTEPVKVAELIADLGPLVEPQATRKKIELSLLPPEDGLTVLADRHRLQQVLVNLVGNAIKFTPEQGTIRVGALPDGVRATIFIADSGIGIPADRLQSIFEPFVQVEDSLTRTAAGAGLGLAISRDLTRAMGGELQVESEMGKGSTFSIVLPLAPSN